MTTLYDLLGALTDDDAEDLRTAFRKAAKTNHPDNNPGDPDAAQRFRQIVRAHAILRDERQRAHYDRLLEAALRQRRGAFLATLIPYAVGCVTFAIVLIAARLLFAHLLTSVPIQGIEASVPQSVPVATLTLTERFDALEQAGPRHTPEDAGLSGKTEETIEKPIEMTIEKPTEQAEVPKENPKQAMTLGVVASAENADDAPSGPIVERVRDYGIDDARYYRQRGIEAYRSGDIAIALTDFDLAIKFDPAFSDAYVDRGIVFYRMGDVKSALADVAQAKRIDDVKQSHASMLGPQ
jgi:tetratricopeptide (TPR) repeat protein